MFSKIIGYAKAWFERSMTESDINSRLIFLVHGLGSTLATLILVIAFIYAKDKESYPFMVGAVAGGSLGAAAGRYMTKKNGGDDKQPPPQPAPKIGDNA